MALTCTNCCIAPAKMKRNGLNQKLCIPCFITSFEDEVYAVIRRYNLITSHDTVAIGVSGGKDSSALLHCLVSLNKRYTCGWKLKLVAVDEGIRGYRDDSLLCVDRAQKRYDLKCNIVSFEERFAGWTMDMVVREIGVKQSCMYCGTFRRQALEYGARQLGCNTIATGHNGDDSIETILMNIFRGDKNRFRSTGVTTGCPCGVKDVKDTSGLVRTKPFFYASQKEVVLYCHYQGLDFFSTECTYAAEAFRGSVRQFLRELDGVDPCIMRFAMFSYSTSTKCICATKSEQEFDLCIRCSSPCKGELCRACVLLESLNSVRQPKAAVCSDFGCA